MTPNYFSKTGEQEAPSGFPGDSVVKNPPVKSGDLGWIPDPGISHISHSTSSCASQPLNRCSRAGEPRLLSRCAPTTEVQAPQAHGVQEAKPPPQETHIPQLEKSLRSNEDLAQPKSQFLVIKMNSFSPGACCYLEENSELTYVGSEILSERKK